MVRNHHWLFLRHLMALVGLLLVLRRDVVGARVGVIALLLLVLLLLLLLLLLEYLLHILLLLMMVLVMLMRVMLLVLHAHRRANGDTLGHDRRRSFVDWHRPHGDILRRIELVAWCCRLRVIWLLSEHVLIVRD
jgi:hypothetical protein